MALEGRGDVELIQPDDQPAGLLGPGLHQQGVAGGLPGVEEEVARQEGRAMGDGVEGRFGMGQGNGVVHGVRAVKGLDQGQVIRPMGGGQGLKHGVPPG